MAENGDPCIFCQIARGEVPSHKIFENDRIFAFLDIHPIRAGHTQIVPKRHYPYFDDLPSELLCEIALAGQALGRTLKEIYKAPRAAFLYAGGDVPHAHAHVLPIFTITDITSRHYIAEEKLTFRSPPSPAPDELRRVADEIRSRFAFG